MSKQRKAAIREERIGGTPETIAKLKTDRLAHLPAEMQRAGWCIELAYRHITADVACRTADYGAARIDGSGKRGGESPATLHHLEAYNNWVDEMHRYRMAVGPVLDIVIEGLSAREVDKRRNQRNGTAGLLLQEALGLYARMRWGYQANGER